jgi:glutamate racemase
VFDSGVGGLSVLREIRNELPSEDLLYVADSAYAPYGDRSEEFILARATAVVSFLVGEHAKAVVVACNTVTGLAIDTLRSRFPIPLVAIEPGVKPAASTTKSGVVGVLATTQTLSSSRFSRLVADHGGDVQILVQPCPGLAEQVEKGDLSSAATRLLVERYVGPLLEKGADTIVLGCTHYPFLEDAIRAVAGPAVSIIDPAAAVARELRRRLRAEGLLSEAMRAGTDLFWTSGTPGEVQLVTSRLLRRKVRLRPLTSPPDGR